MLLRINERDYVSMSGRKSAESKKEAYIIEQNRQIMLKLADQLLQDNLITPEETFRLKQMIQRGGSI